MSSLFYTLAIIASPLVVPITVTVVNAVSDWAEASRRYPRPGRPAGLRGSSARCRMSCVFADSETPDTHSVRGFAVGR